MHTGSAPRNPPNSRLQYLSGCQDSGKDVSEEIAHVTAEIYRYDGIVGALNRMMRHIDFVPYDFDLMATSAVVKG